MRTYKTVFALFILLLVFSSCEKNIDTEKPVVDLTFSEVFPYNCDTIYFGESFDLKMLLTDNVELGSFSLDIHNNFDHHSHSTVVSECDLDPIKTPENPFLYIEDFSVPTGQSSYETNIPISIPEGEGGNLYDEGDYHLFISLTDMEGWSTQVGLSIKMYHRQD